MLDSSCTERRLGINNVMCNAPGSSEIGSLSAPTKTFVRSPLPGRTAMYSPEMIVRNPLMAPTFNSGRTIQNFVPARARCAAEPVNRAFTSTCLPSLVIPNRFTWPTVEPRKRICVLFSSRPLASWKYRVMTGPVAM